MNPEEFRQDLSAGLIVIMFKCNLHALGSPVQSTDDCVPAETFDGKTAPIATVIPWVASHICIKDVNASDATSADAWAMLVWAQRNETNQSEFRRNIYPKLLPSRAQLKATERLRDNGRDLSNLEDELLRMHKEMAAKKDETREPVTETDE